MAHLHLGHVPHEPASASANGASRSFRRSPLAVRLAAPLMALGVFLAVVPASTMEAAAFDFNRGPSGPSPFVRAPGKQGPGFKLRHQIQASPMERVIVQFDPSKDRESEIRRILDALDGLPHKVASTFEVTPAIVLEVNAKGMERLRALPGVMVQMDSLAKPN